MPVRLISRLCWLFGLLAAIGLAAGPSHSQTPQHQDDLNRILSLIEQRQKQAGIIRVKAEGTRFMPKGAASTMFPPMDPRDKTPRPSEDTRSELRQDVTLDFRNNRWRKQFSEKTGEKFQSNIVVFDGTRIIGAKSDLPIEQLESFQPSQLSAESGSGKADIFNSEWWPYFVSAGFMVTHHRRPHFLGEFAIPIDGENLFVHGRGAVDGVACTILRTFPFGPKKEQRYFEYAIGRDDGAVRRLATWANDFKEIEIIIAYRKEGDHLFPKSWVHDRFLFRQARLYTRETMTVTSVEIGDHLGDRFTLTPAVGAIIKERQYPEGTRVLLRETPQKNVHYQVDESGRWVEGELVDGVFRPRRRYLWWWILGGAALVVTAGLCVLRWRNREASVVDQNPQTGGST